MNVAWTPVENVNHYELSVFPLPPKIPENFQLMETQISFEELSPDTQYQINVRAVLQTGPITNSGFTTARTAPEPPNIIVHTVRSSWAKHFFTPIKDAKDYKVTLSPPINGQSDFSQKQTKLNFVNLQPSVKYTLTVQGILDYAMTDTTSIVFETGLFIRQLKKNSAKFYVSPVTQVEIFQTARMSLSSLKF